MRGVRGEIEEELGVREGVCKRGGVRAVRE